MEEENKKDCSQVECEQSNKFEIKTKFFKADETGFKIKSNSNSDQIYISH